MGKGEGVRVKGKWVRVKGKWIKEKGSRREVEMEIVR
jgi:hypothetical protein